MFQEELERLMNKFRGANVPASIYGRRRHDGHGWYGI